MTDHVCTEKDTLADIKDMLEEMHRTQAIMHKKLFESNGERALVEIIRENTVWREKMDVLFKKAVGGMIALIIGGHGLDRLVEFFLQG